MEKLEKKILIKGRTHLETSMSHGAFDDWYDKYMKLKHGVEAFLSITRPLIEEDNDNEK